MGVATWRDLAGCDSTAVIAAMRRRRYFLSAEQIDTWRHHATSYATNAPHVFGGGPELPAEFIALDLEYTPAHLWLIGACVHRVDADEHHAFWADNSEEVRANLACLQALLSTHLSLPVLTWAGDGADLPMLRGAARRHRMPEVIAAVEVRHVDMYQYLRRHLRLPIPSMGLKDVGLYFEVSRSGSIGDGLVAQMMYERYRQARGTARVDLREQLLGYNRDDVTTLVEVALRVRGIVRQRGAVAVTLAGG
jgi:predicted RecB family nuclease